MLFVMFVGLKITGNIDWGWGAVLTPLYMMASIYILGVLLAASRMKQE